MSEDNHASTAAEPTPAKQNDQSLTKIDFTFDPTDNCDPYGDKSYVRREFKFLHKTKNANIASTYEDGKGSALIYDAQIDGAGLKCFHLMTTLMNPLSCAYCNHEALKKYTFHRVYDDHVETNIPTSCCRIVVDNTNVYYLDRDWAQNFEQATPCCPSCTHCLPTADCCGCYGNTVIGFGSTNCWCNPGGRRIDFGLAGYRGDCTGGGPWFGYCGLCDKQWVCFPFVTPDSKDAFINALKEQRSNIVSKFNIVVHKAGIPSGPDSGEQSR